MASFIEFLIFTGVAGELRQWISWLEDFFVREKFTADEKMNLAQSLLEGDAESWFYSQKRSIFQSWEHLMDLLIWRFGDFSDPELFLLWDKNARLLPKKRDDAKLRRMSRTAITPHESIPLLASIHETVPVAKFSEQQVDEISGETKESKKELNLSLGKIVSHLKSTLESQPDVPCHENANANLPNTTVHVSDSENLRNIEIVAMKAKIQKNIGMDVVNGDVENIQCVMSINVSAHQVLDKMCQLKGLKTKKKMKVLKSWMFKYKPERRRSRKRHNRDWFNTLSRRESWRKHKHENLQIVSGLLGFNVVSFRCHKEYGIVRLINWSQVRAYYSLMQGQLFCTNSLSRNLPSITVIGAKFKFKHGLETRILIQGNLSSTEELVRNDFTSDGILDGEIAELLNSIGGKLQSCGYVVVRVHQQQQKRKSTKSWRFKYKGRLKKIKLTYTKFLWEKVHMVSCLSLDAQFHSLEFQLKHKWRSKHLHTKSALEFQVVEHIRVVVFKVQPLSMEIAAVLDSFAPVFVIVILVVVDRLSKVAHVLGLTHLFQPGLEIGVHQQWLNRDTSENSWLLSRDFVNLYPPFKLEEKLVLQGESIDTNHQAYYRKQRETSTQKELAVGESDVAADEVEVKTLEQKEVLPLTLRDWNKRRKQSSLLFLCHL